jgi:hypothetical protein
MCPGDTQCKDLSGTAGPSPNHGRAKLRHRDATSMTMKLSGSIKMGKTLFKLGGSIVDWKNISPFCGRKKLSQRNAC